MAKRKKCGMMTWSATIAGKHNKSRNAHDWFLSTQLR